MSLYRKHRNNKGFSHISRLKCASLAAVALFGISDGYSMNENVQSTPKIIASNGVQNELFVLNHSDGKSAAFYEFNDRMILDLGGIVSKGSSYSIVWRKASINPEGSSAQLIVRESASSSNFIKNKKSPKSSSESFITSEFIAQSDIRFVMITTASPMDDAIDVDGVFVRSSILSEDSEKIIVNERRKKANTHISKGKITPNTSEISKKEKLSQEGQAKKIPSITSKTEKTSLLRNRNGSIKAKTGLFSNDSAKKRRRQIFWQGTIATQKRNYKLKKAYHTFTITNNKEYALILSNSGDPPELITITVMNSMRPEIRPPPS